MLCEGEGNPNRVIWMRMSGVVYYLSSSKLVECLASILPDQWDWMGTNCSSLLPLVLVLAHSQLDSCNYYQIELDHTRLGSLPLVLGPDGRAVLLECMPDVTPLLTHYPWLPCTFN